MDRFNEIKETWKDRNISTFSAPILRVAVDDIDWLIKTIDEQQRELQGWRNEFQGI